jgi:hypothetical protein
LILEIVLARRKFTPLPGPLREGELAEKMEKRNYGWTRIAG